MECTKVVWFYKNKLIVFFTSSQVSEWVFYEQNIFVFNWIKREREESSFMVLWKHENSVPLTT